MFIFYLFSGIILSALFFATFISDVKKSILALWAAGLGVGSLFLILGAEFLAIVQWIVSTLTAISFIFFAVLFGEHQRQPSNKIKTRFIQLLLSLLSGGFFLFFIVLGSNRTNSSSSFKEIPHEVPEFFNSKDNVFYQDGFAVSLKEEGLSLPPTIHDDFKSYANIELVDFGKILISDQFLSLEILGLLFFLVLIGAGMAARQAKRSSQ